MSNMPPSFTVTLPDAIISMGLHAWDPAKEPSTPEEWIDPIYIILCSYDSNIVAVERPCCPSNM
jgi:hypothetical protein